jgi:hypothetical protein
MLCPSLQTQAEIGVMLPQGKQCQEPPAAERLLLEGLWRELADNLILGFWYLE